MLRKYAYYYFLIKLFNLIKKALPDGIADYVILKQKIT